MNIGAGSPFGVSASTAVLSSGPVDTCSSPKSVPKPPGALCTVLPAPFSGANQAEAKAAAHMASACSKGSTGDKERTRQRPQESPG